MPPVPVGEAAVGGKNDVVEVSTRGAGIEIDRLSEGIRRNEREALGELAVQLYLKRIVVAMGVIRLIRIGSSAEQFVFRPSGAARPRDLAGVDVDVVAGRNIHAVIADKGHLQGKVGGQRPL